MRKMKFMKLFGYPGGQKRLLKTLLKLLPNHEDYIEVFGGGATLLLNKEPSKFEVYNDVNSNITNLFTVVRDDFDGFADAVEFFLQSRELFNDFKTANVKEMDPLKQAAMYYYRLRTSFDGKAESFSVKKHGKKGGATFPFKLRQEIKDIHLRLKRVVIESLDFTALVKKYDNKHALFFCDPPYYAIKGLYECDFTEEDHVRFFRALRNVQGKYLVTYGDHEYIRLLWRKSFQRPLTTTGSMGTEQKRKKVHHLLLANYNIVDFDFDPFTSTYFEF